LIKYKLKSFLLLYFSAQFLRFIFCGGISAFVNWSSRLILDEVFLLNSNLSFIIAYFTGLFTAFFLYRRFVFPHSDLSPKLQGIRFLIINFGFFPVAISIFNILNAQLLSLGFKYSESLAHIFVIALPAIITFLFYKFFAFRIKN